MAWVVCTIELLLIHFNWFEMQFKSYLCCSQNAFVHWTETVQRKILIMYEFKMLGLVNISIWTYAGLAWLYHVVTTLKFTYSSQTVESEWPSFCFLLTESGYWYIMSKHHEGNIKVFHESTIFQAFWKHTIAFCELPSMKMKNC